MFLNRVVAVLLGLLVLPLGLAGQEQTFKLDADKSEVHFLLDDPLHKVQGSFHAEPGAIQFSHKDGSMSGTIAVDARSGQSGNAGRDKKMTQDELQAAKYTTVTFAPKHYSGTLAATGDSTITVDGSFTLLGTAHEISVPMQVHIDGTQCKAAGSFVIPYVQWGMKDPSNFLLHVGKEVKIDLALVGTITP